MAENPVICKKCRKRKHYKCKNGPWLIGTHCTCQHRIKVEPGWAIYLAHQFGTLETEITGIMKEENK